MGGLARSLFGGSKEKSTSTQSSENRAFPWLQSTFSPVAQNGVGASSMLANLLGIGGGDAQTGAWDTFRNNTGYKFGFDQGQEAIVGSAAAKGLRNSGSAAKALTKYGQDYASTKYNDYLSQLLGLGNMGLQAGNIVGNAGNVSQSTSTSKGSSTKGGFSGVVGSLLGK